MEIIAYGLVFFGLLMVIVLLLNHHFLLTRNNQVYELRIRVIKACYEWNQVHLKEITFEGMASALVSIYEQLPSYDQMIFSLKPVKPASWLDKETIQKLGL